MIFIPHLGFVPLWDGRGYADVLVQAARFPPRLAEFNAFGHPSAGFMLLVGLGQFFDPGNTYLINAANLLFGLAGVWAFFSILESCFPGGEQRPENVCVASVFAVLPMVVGSELNLNPDTGVLVFSLLLVSFLLADRYRAAAVAAVLMMNSKETGVLLYPIILGLYLLVYVGPGPASLREKIRQAWRRSFGFAPGFLLLAVTAFNRFGGNPMRLLRVGPATLRDFASLDLSGIRAANLTMIWVVNFDWIPTCFIAAALIVVLFRILRGRPRLLAGGHRRAISFLFSLSVVVLYVLTRFQTFTNPRYLLPIFPFFVLGFGLSLRVLIGRSRLRLAVLSTFLLLALASCFRTIDPVSRRIYGTLSFGSHDLLHITSLTGDTLGTARDQLTYNLEYTRIHSIQNRMFAGIRPDRSTTFVIDPMADWLVHGYLEPNTFRRTLRSIGSLRPRYLNAESLFRLSRLPAVVYYVFYPNVTNDGVSRLFSSYRIDGMTTFSEDGYTVPVLRMSLRPTQLSGTSTPSTTRRFSSLIGRSSLTRRSRDQTKR